MATKRVKGNAQAKAAQSLIDGSWNPYRGRTSWFGGFGANQSPATKPASGKGRGGATKGGKGGSGKVGG